MLSLPGILVGLIEPVYMMVEDKEQQRINVLRRYDILDTPPDGSLERLTALASKVFQMPIVIISMVDTDRIWFKSHHGLDVEQVDRDPGLCDSAILSNEVYIVENPKEDLRTLANPLVASSFGLEFYAGAPLKTHDGFNLGTFCLIDKRRRYLIETQKETLREFAAVAMDEIEIRLAARTNTKKVNQALQETSEFLNSASYQMDQISREVHHEELRTLAQQTRAVSQRLDSQRVG